MGTSNTQVALPSQGTTQQVSSTQPSPAKWRRRSYALWLNLGGAAFILSLGTIWYAHHQTEELKRQTDLQEYTLLRATGGITAEIECADFHPTPKEFGKDMRTTAFGGEDKPFYKDLETFIKFRPNLILNNVGEEPIEAIRVVTSLVEVGVDLPNRLKKYPELGLLLREQEVDDIPLSPQWRPGTSVQISLLKGALAQMRQIQSKKFQNTMHKALMHVTISGKITGGTVFGNEKGKMFAFRVWWMPSGFPEEKCREVVESYQSRVRFFPQKWPVTIRHAD